MTGFRDLIDLQGIAALRWRDADGLHVAGTMRYRDADNVLQTVDGLGNIVATAAPTAVYGYGNSHAPIRISTQAAAVTLKGGTAPFTYSWTCDSGLFDPVAPTSPSSAFRTIDPVASGDLVTDNATCAVTDARGKAVDSNTIALSVTNFGI